MNAVLVPELNLDNAIYSELGINNPPSLYKPFLLGDNRSI
jgi:hypothetical protein